MTVYELIQELAQYEADAKVNLKVTAHEYECVTVDGEDVTVNIDNDSFFDIDDISSERRFGSKPSDIVIDITY